MGSIEMFKKELAEVLRPVLREELERVRREDEPLLSKKQIIEKLGCTYSTFRIMEETLILPSHLVGRRVLYKESEVKEAIKSSGFIKQKRKKVLN